MIKEVKLLNKASVRIVHGNQRFEKPEELINFVENYPEKAEIMQKRGIIKIINSKDKENEK